jgi:predicted nuclease of predicted toxin-antitoxin system
MARFYSNENFPQGAVEELRKLGHDVLTSLEAGKANQRIPDEEVLAFATNENRILLTLNRKHFIKLHESGEDHSGIVVCTQDNNFVGLALRIHAAVEDEPMAGVLLRVNRPA